MALGASNQAGGRAWNIIGYDDWIYEKNGKDISCYIYYLDGPLPEEIINKIDNSSEIFYDIIVPSVNRIKDGVILGINATGNYFGVIVEKLVNSPRPEEDWSEENRTSRFFKLTDYPFYGEVAFGSCATALGLNNKATAIGGTALGYNNHADGKYSLVAGKENFAGYAAIALGQGNKSIGLNSVGIGYGNTVDGQAGIALGYYNSVKGNYGGAIGEKLISNSPSQIVVGSYNALDNNAKFIVGVGNSEGNRNNALVVYKDGRASVALDPQLEKDIVTKGYADRSIKQSMD